MDDLKRGDVVEFNGNPFDEQLGEYAPKGEFVVTAVMDVRHLKGTSGQWVKVEGHNWISKSWFRKKG